MKKFKGTKGKWIIGWGDGLTGPTTVKCDGPCVSDRDYIPISINKETIAIVIEPDAYPKKQLEANAKLIASSLELLKALQELVYEVDGEWYTGCHSDACVSDIVKKVLNKVL